MNQIEKNERRKLEIDTIPIYDWELKVGRLTRTRELVDYLGKEQSEGTRIRCNWDEVKRELNALNIEDRSFLITLREHLAFLHSKGYPEIQAHRKKLRTYADMVCEFEWIKITPEPPISLKCKKVTAEEVKEEVEEEEEPPVIIGGKEWPWETIPPHIREQLRKAKKDLETQIGVEGTLVVDYPEAVVLRKVKVEEKVEEETKEEEKKVESGSE